MGKIRTALVAVAVAGSAATVVAIGTMNASAADDVLAKPHLISTGSAGDMVVDPVNRRVLVSDQSLGKVIAVDYQGVVTRSATGLTGVRGLALAADSRTVFAARPAAHEIVALDPATLAVTARHPLGSAVFPHTLTVTSGKVWFGYQDQEGVGGFGSLDLTPATPLITRHDSALPLSGAPDLHTNPGAPGILLVRDDSTNDPSTGTAAVYRVSAGVELLSAGKVAGNQTAGAAVSSDGASVLFLSVASGCSRSLAPVEEITRTTDAYGCGDAHVADADASGRVAIAGFEPSLAVYPAGSQKASRTYEFAPQNGMLNAPGHVALEPGGPRTFTLTGDFQKVYLWVAGAPEKVTSKITTVLTTPARRGEPLTITGQLVAAQAVASSTTLTVTRTDLLSPSGKVLPALRLDTRGGYELTDTPPAGGPVTYTIAYAGSDLVGPSSGKMSLDLDRAVTSLVMSASGTNFSYGGTATLTARLGATYSSRVVEFWADPYGADQGPRLLRRATVDKAGYATASIKLTRSTGVTATFTGDARSRVASARLVLGTRVAVSTTATRHYKTASSTSYFRKSVHPYFTTTMTAYPGRKQRLQFQVLSGGQWKAWKEATVPVNAAGKSFYTLTGAHTTGVRYRVRAAYLSGVSGDTVNITTYGAYRNFTFTK